MKMTPQVVFDGQCEEAFKFYEQALGAKVTFMLTWASSPMASEAPEGWGHRILHATLEFGDSILQGGDGFPGQPYQAPRGFSILVSVTDPAQAERIFNALAQQGTVVAPLQKTFWSKLYGAVKDRFGLSWDINCD